MLVGVLALQGCVQAHIDHFHLLQGVKAIAINRPSQLNGVQGLVLPGGESTTISRLIRLLGFENSLQEKAQEIPFWGVCAGSILMAKDVEEESLVRPFSWMDITVKRNAYGRQRESFLEVIEGEFPHPQDGLFIRAPKFVSWGKGVKVLGRCQGEVVFLEEGRHIVTAFHPELSRGNYFHEYFLSILRRAPLNITAPTG